MNADRWQKLKSILAEALEHESPSTRSAVIEHSCANDVDLLREAESLLAAEPNATDALEECADNLAVTGPSQNLSEIGRRVGAYVIIREIGRGGMGTVYLAARADGYFEKEVAIKVLNRGAAKEDALRRFRAEREVLACLDHPNIARLIDAGTMDDGRPYFIMDYVDGVPITRYVEERASEVRERLNLFLKVSAAVEAAHRKSIIHRDLKPNNILVNREGEPKLLDFGIAKVIGGETNPLETTSFKQQRLTPSSASPEQIKGEPVTVFSDVYQLGVVLYEILTGVRPHRFDTSHPTDEELVEVICKQLPSLPSLAGDDRERQRRLRGDLDAILVRALQKEPSLRYSSVAGFAEDVRCHLAGKPLQARGSKAGRRGSTAFLHDRRVQIASAFMLLCLIGLPLGLVVRSHLGKNSLSRGGSGAQLTDRTSIAVSPFDSLTTYKKKALTGNDPTRDMLANDLYLRARESLFQNNYSNAIHLLEQAISRDPQFALAYCLLAEAHLYMYRFDGDRTPGRLDEAKQAAETALRLAPKLPQSHLAKAQFYYYGLHDYEHGLAELHTARSFGGEQAEFVDLSALIERRLGHWNEAIRDAERAAELDPQNPFVIRNLVENYVSVRRFSDADRTAGKAIKDAVTRDAVARGGSLWTLRTEALLSTGRIDDARTVIKSSPEDATRLYELIWVELFARDFARASQLVEAVVPSEKESFDAAFFDGVTARAQGDVSRTRSAFQRARDWALVKLGEQPNDPELISDLSLADAALGRKESAVQEARKAVELCPMSHDAVDGPNYETQLAMVYAWIGERDAAMAELKKMVKLPRGPTWGELRFSPLWNDIRTDARFDSLLTQAALPPVYN